MIISRCLVTVRRLLSVAALGALLTWPSVGRVATTVMFDMPAQPLSQALAAFSEQTGISILVTSDLIHNKIAAPVHGRLTPTTALRALLEPTDLEVRRVDASAWTLLPREPQHTDTVTPPANTVTHPTHALPMFIKVTTDMHTRSGRALTICFRHVPKLTDF